MVLSTDARVCPDHPHIAGQPVPQDTSCKMRADAAAKPRLYSVILPFLADMLDSNRHSRAAGFSESACASLDGPSMLGWLRAAVLAVQGEVDASASSGMGGWQRR